MGRSYEEDRKSLEELCARHCAETPFVRSVKIVKTIYEFLLSHEYGAEEANYLADNFNESGVMLCVCPNWFPWRPFLYVSACILFSSDFIGGPKDYPDLGGVIFGLTDARFTERRDYFRCQAELWIDRHPTSSSHEAFVIWLERWSNRLDRYKIYGIIQQHRKIVMDLDKAVVERRNQIEFTVDGNEYTILLSKHCWRLEALRSVADMLFSCSEREKELVLAKLMYKEIIRSDARSSRINALGP